MYIILIYILYLTGNDDLSLITMFKYILTYLFSTICIYTHTLYQSYTLNNICIFLMIYTIDI